MNRQKLALDLFWIGLIVAVAFASIGIRSLVDNLRTLTIEENNIRAILEETHESDCL